MSQQDRGRKLIELKAGDKIPEGAVFVTTHKQKRMIGRREEIVSRGFISDLVREVPIFDEQIVCIYSVPMGP